MAYLGRRQNLERLNVERPIFRNFEISNIYKDELFDFLFSIFFSMYLRIKISNSKIREWLSFRIWPLTNIQM